MKYDNTRKMEKEWKKNFGEISLGSKCHGEKVRQEG